MDPIYERLDMEVDVDRLREEFLAHVSPLPPVMQSESFGGWAILTRNGSYRDGWAPGHMCLKTDANGKPQYDHALAAKLGHGPTADYNTPTEVCTDYALRVIDMIREAGLSPARARWAVLKAGTASALHRDAWEHVYGVRLHIPIITNPYCTFEQDGEAAHLPADGGMYLVKVNRLHQIWNRSDEDRIHLFMDVKDTKGISQFNRYP